jgi:hypothetical protein
VESISDPAIRSPKRRTAAEVGHGCWVRWKGRKLCHMDRTALFIGCSLSWVARQLCPKWSFRPAISHSCLDFASFTAQYLEFPFCFANRTITFVDSRAFSSFESLIPYSWSIGFCFLFRRKQRFMRTPLKEKTMAGSYAKEKLLNKNTLFPSLFFFFYLRYWGLSSGPSPWATPPVLFVMGIVKIGSRELLAWTGF